MTRYAINRDALYSAFKDFLYSEINANPALESATVDDLADIVLAKKWRIFLPDGIKRTTAEKAAQRVLYMTNQPENQTQQEN
ncbi:hypothetical protein HW452_17235 [Halomonas aquamarina]|uniref:Uncharacterized protein n=1 Tax=Vreelandella aquamarina TaxID=77097 RepID=A0ACC5VYK6_9GAMM|nr:hypothetical protein [Halomonas aquamarina]MBZ5489263.1 hypothetical protein [Halomonas aquamarina]